MRPGEDLLAQIYTSLLANLPAFQRTLLIITFDEHGGTFDHVHPPVAVPPDGCHQEGFAFDRYGVRVPTLFVSPRVLPSTLLRAGLPHEWPPFDHTSIAATVPLALCRRTRSEGDVKDSSDSSRIRTRPR